MVTDSNGVELVVDSEDPLKATATAAANDDDDNNVNEGKDPGSPPAAESSKETPDIMSQVIGPSYAPLMPPCIYWVELFCITIQAIGLSFFCLGYLNVVFWIPELIFTMNDNEGFPEDPSTTTFLSGNPAWIGIGALTGLLVGIAKAYVFRFDTYAGFLEDLMELGGDDDDKSIGWGWIGVPITCLLSLMGGASLGPESGLGSACTSLSVLYAKYVVDPCCSWAQQRCCHRNNDNNSTALENGGDNSEENNALSKEERIKRRKLIVLCGLVSAFSTILPTPASAIIMCVELPGFEALSVKHGLPFVRTITQSVVAGTFSFFFFDWFFGDTFLPTENIIPGFLHEYQNSDIPLAIAIGCVGALLTVGYFIFGGIVKKIVGVSKVALDARFGETYRILVLCILGGTLFGLLGYIFPLTLGDGSAQIGAIISERSGRNISTAVLVASCFAKMLAFWISQEFGFVGGLFYPILLVSSMAGRVIVNEFGTPWAMTLACALVAVPSAFTPMPLASLVLATSLFNMSSRSSVPVLVTVVTAHVLFAGIGIPQAMLRLAKPKQ